MNLERSSRNRKKLNHGFHGFTRIIIYHEEHEEHEEKIKRVKSNCKSKSKKVNHEWTRIDTNKREKKKRVKRKKAYSVGIAHPSEW
jgi:hypothetical protein